LSTPPFKAAPTLALLLSFLVEEEIAGRSELDPPGSAIEKQDAEFPFESAYLLAERGLRQVLPLRRMPEVQLFGDRDEVPAVVEAPWPL